jgi:hypothetical protein
MQKTLISFCILLLNFVPLYSQSQLFSLSANTSARAAGMGGAYTAVADDPSAIIWNAANMSYITSTEISISTQVGDIKYEVDRFPAEEIQQWESDAVAKFNIKYFAIILPVAEGGLNTKIGIAFNYYPILTSESTERIQTNDLQTLVTNTSYSGGIYSISSALSINIFSDLAIGAVFNFYGGEERSSVRKSLDSITFARFETLIQYSGTSLGFAAVWNFGESFFTGLSLELPHTLRRGSRLQTDVFFPFAFNFGAAYKLDSKLILSFDYFQQPLSKITITDNQSRYNYQDFDLNSVRFGLEYSILFSSVQLPIRVGYYTKQTFLENLNGNQIIEDVFTFGLGFYIGGVRLNTALEWLPFREDFAVYEAGGGRRFNNISVNGASYRFTFDMILAIK